MTRCVLTAAVLLALQLYVLANSQYMVDKTKALKDVALAGHAFRNLTMETISDCLFACMTDCLCIAFQTCTKTECQLPSSNQTCNNMTECQLLSSNQTCKNMTECQLLSSNQYQASSSLTNVPGCSYYDMIPDQPQQITNENLGNPPCDSEWSCCYDSNPCQNGGTCLPVFSVVNTTRFRCYCPPGYTGDICDQPIQSCRGYINGSRAPGNYTVFDAQMKPFEVFCDFDSDSTMAWTLIQSYQYQYNYQHSKTSFAENNPVHQSSPVWDSYRLSKSTMESIQNDSSKWRITCRYDTDGVVYTDYVRGANDKTNILTYEGDGCVEVEYVDIRGQKCGTEPCTVYAAQRKSSYAFHLEYCASGCNFNQAGSHSCTCYHNTKPYRCALDQSEDNFGHYSTRHSAHRCTATQTSTTQTWFGGY